MLLRELRTPTIMAVSRIRDPNSNPKIPGPYYEDTPKGSKLVETATVTGVIVQGNEARPDMV